MSSVNGNNKQANMMTVPFSLEAEEALLGAILLDSKSFLDVAEIIDPDDFFIKRHEWVFRAIVRLQDDKMPIDYVTVTKTLRDSGHLDEIGGQAFLMKLVNNTPSSVHALVYAHLVERTSRRRKLLAYSDNVRKHAMNEDIKIDDVMTDILNELHTIQDHAPRHRARHVRSVADSLTERWVENLELYNTDANYLTGISTGFTQLDNAIDGMKEGAIFTVAGATKVGKTNFVLNIVLNALTAGKKRLDTTPAHCVMFCGEMTEEDLMIRLISMLTGINTRRIRRGAFRYDKPDDRVMIDAINQAIQDISRMPLHFETGQRIDTTQLKRAVREYLSRGELDLLILDSILQIDSPKMPKNGTDKDWLNINYALEGLEEIAQEFRIPILATAQIGRSGYTGKPKLEDIKRASSIEEKSSEVALLYDTKSEDSHGRPVKKLYLAANRHGEKRTINFTFNGASSHFAELYEQYGKQVETPLKSYQ